MTASLYDGSCGMLLRRIEIILEGTLRQLLREPQRAGNWGDVRGTADSLIAIHQCLPDERFPALRRYASEWLLTRMYSDVSGMGNWEEEVWDTAIATLALSEEPVGKEPVAKAILWLAELFQETHGNWNDEPWETLWALLAIHAAHTKADAPMPAIDFEKSLRWLISLRGTPSAGILVNWHYTALFCLVAQRYSSHLMQTMVSDEVRAALTSAYIESTRCIALALDRLPDKELWTNEVWSNSIAIWALAESEEIRGDLPGLIKLVDWFQEQLQDQHQSFTEDLAFACISLGRLVVGLERAKELAFARNIDNIKGENGPEIRAIIEQCAEIISHARSAGLRERLSCRLRTFRDHIPRAPFLTKDVFHGYYTVNLRDFPTKLFLIIVATATLTVAAHSAQAFFGEKVGRVVIWVPLALGALTTIAGLMNFSLNLFSYRKAPRDVND